MFVFDIVGVWRNTYLAELEGMLFAKGLEIGADKDYHAAKGAGGRQLMVERQHGTLPLHVPSNWFL